jgi:teichuronic acid biosynthesis protein TuaE
MWALRVLPVLAALGPTFFLIEIAGAGLFPFRIAAGVLLLLTLGARSVWRKSRVMTLYLRVLLIWTLWSGASLWWAPDINVGIDETITTAFGLVVAITIFNLGIERDSHLEAFSEGWMLAYVVAAGFALRDLLTGDYLPGPKGELYVSRGIDDIAISTFGNPNNYAAFILLAVPFMVLGYWLAGTRRKQRLVIVLLASVPVFVFYSTSRLALIGVTAQFVLFAVIGLKTRRQRVRYIAAGALVVLLIGSFFWEGSRTANDLTNLVEQGLSGESNTSRLNLTLNGLWMAVDSGGLGVGAGGYEVVTKTEYTPYPTGGLATPHNFWIEVLAQYGVVVFGLLLFWFARIAVIAFRARRVRNLHPGTSLLANAVVVAGAGYLFASVANSNFVAQSTNLVFLAGLAAIAGRLEWGVAESGAGERAEIVGGRRRPGRLTLDGGG